MRAGASSCGKLGSCLNSVICGCLQKCHHSNLIFLSEINFAAKNENLKRSQKQQSAEYTAEQYTMERAFAGAAGQGVLFFYRCGMGLSRSVHNAQELLPQAWTQDSAPVDNALGSACRERYHAYVGFVSSKTGIDADAGLDVDDPVSMQKIVAAMSHMENGKPALLSDVEKGWNLSLG